MFRQGTKRTREGDWKTHPNGGSSRGESYSSTEESSSSTESEARPSTTTTPWASIAPVSLDLVKPSDFGLNEFPKDRPSAASTVVSNTSSTTTVTNTQLESLARHATQRLEQHVVPPSNAPPMHQRYIMELLANAVTAMQSTPPPAQAALSYPQQQEEARRRQQEEARKLQLQQAAEQERQKQEAARRQQEEARKRQQQQQAAAEAKMRQQEEAARKQEQNRIQKEQARQREEKERQERQQQEAQNHFQRQFQHQFQQHMQQLQKQQQLQHQQQQLQQPTLRTQAPAPVAPAPVAPAPSVSAPVESPATLQPMTQARASTPQPAYNIAPQPPAQSTQHGFPPAQASQHQQPAPSQVPQQTYHPYGQPHSHFSPQQQALAPQQPPPQYAPQQALAPQPTANPAVLPQAILELVQKVGTLASAVPQNHSPTCNTDSSPNANANQLVQLLLSSMTQAATSSATAPGAAHLTAQSQHPTASLPPIAQKPAPSPPAPAKKDVWTGSFPMSTYTDTERMSKYQIMVREQLEFFIAEQKDVESSTQGRKKPVLLGQVGIRCMHCAHLPLRKRLRGAVYYPARLDGVYQAAQNMSTTHLLDSCGNMEEFLRRRLQKLKESKLTAMAGKQDWAQACRKMGIYEVPGGGLRMEQLPEQLPAPQKAQQHLPNSATQLPKSPSDTADGDKVEHFAV